MPHFTSNMYNGHTVIRQKIFYFGAMSFLMCN